MRSLTKAPSRKRPVLVTTTFSQVVAYESVDCTTLHKGNTCNNIHFSVHCEVEIGVTWSPDNSLDSLNSSVFALAI